MEQTKKQSKWAWTLTIIVTVLALLSAVIGTYGLIQGYAVNNMLRITWFSVTALVLGVVIAVLSWWTFSQRTINKTAWAWMQVVWTLCAIGLIVAGVLATIEIQSKQGLIWLPICVTINGGLLLIDKINYLINHFVRISKQPQQA